MHACEGLELGVFLCHSWFWLVCLASLPQETACLQLPWSGITGFYMSGVNQILVLTVTQQVLTWSHLPIPELLLLLLFSGAVS